MHLSIASCVVIMIYSRRSKQVYKQFSSSEVHVLPLGSGALGAPHVGGIFICADIMLLA
jgi:hypothetical protein